ncbi:MAG: thioredoxin family protein [Dehalococcoidia bacterium]
MSRVLQLTDGNFKEEVFQSGVPVLVEFSGSWCVPSQQMRPMLEKMAAEHDGEFKIGYLNVDQNPKAASQFQIMGCPTFIAFNAEQPVTRRVGAQTKRQLREMMQEAVGAREQRGRGAGELGSRGDGGRRGRKRLERG